MAFRLLLMGCCATAASSVGLRGRDQAFEDIRLRKNDEKLRKKDWMFPADVATNETALVTMWQAAPAPAKASGATQVSASAGVDGFLRPRSGGKNIAEGNAEIVRAGRLVTAVGKRAFSRSLHTMTPTSDWDLAGPDVEGGFYSIAIVGDVIYAVAFNGMTLLRQSLSSMTLTSGWTDAGKGTVRSIAVYGNVIYAVDHYWKVVSQTWSTMTPTSDWNLACGEGRVSSIAITGDTIFATIYDSDREVVYQRLSEMAPTSPWKQAGSGPAKSIAIFGDVIYAVGNSGDIFKQRLSKMTVRSAWELAGKGEVRSIAVSGSDIFAVGGDTLKIYSQKLPKILTPSIDWNVSKTTPTIPPTASPCVGRRASRSTGATSSGQ